ncbi:hypothetical protein LVJ81_05400 [Vitreoscilla stercoraria]|uniref:Uncharacterized protein n=1 Tax=Vitreoscilla stercoraria TaxID=61 RepID=A0ABY4EDD6_VITST|nr:hypothetical protein [Vitreoscilla sp. C1]UOO93467.1 hypothetical protein LVJ81_05400 [Vitreoscilla stercoraria]
MVWLVCGMEAGVGGMATEAGAGSWEHAEIAIMMAVLKPSCHKGLSVMILSLLIFLGCMTAQDEP